MARKRNRYREMEQFMTYFLIGDGVVFLLFLLASAFGVTWLKVITALLCLGVSALGIGYLYLSGELRPRSRWMSIGFAAVLLCLLVSLLLRYPSPDPNVVKTPGSTQTNPNGSGTSGVSPSGTGGQGSQQSDPQGGQESNPQGGQEGDSQSGQQGTQGSDQGGQPSESQGASGASEGNDSTGQQGTQGSGQSA